MKEGSVVRHERAGGMLWWALNAEGRRRGCYSTRAAAEVSMGAKAVIGVPVRRKVTACQAETIDHIERYREAHGYPPTIRELCVSLGLSLNAVTDRLKALRSNGLVTWEPGLTRSVRLVGTSAR